MQHVMLMLIEHRYFKFLARHSIYASSRNSKGFSRAGASNKGGVVKSAVFCLYAWISRKR